MGFSHIDKKGKASMVDVGAKAVTPRAAAAMAAIKMDPKTLELIKSNSAAKGDVLACARFAGIQGGKKTAELIPLCHAIQVDKISIDFQFDGEDTLIIKSSAKCEGKTGVEMEALTAAAVAALTVYDMCKAVDRAMIITDIKLLFKSGGASGQFSRNG
ncbi:MAG: cyclic pyranopterin monophosphate synthase MoaC [Clostridiales bacterium]|nr:cyclic pyranopterin monophosphate synthase MoaC [Clostridiales bacterium]